MGSLIITSSTLIATKQKNYICIDAGHGGIDPGTSNNRYLEKDITLKAAFYLGNYLEQSGYNVLYTRTKDEMLSSSKSKDIYKRSEIINKNNNILYISLHANAFSDKSVHGAQVFYHFDSESKCLAEFIQDRICKFDETNKRVAKSINNVYILDHQLTTGCLVELGFLSNETDLKFLINDEFLQRLTFSIYVGIMQYLEYLK